MQGHSSWIIDNGEIKRRDDAPHLHSHLVCGRVEVHRVIVRVIRCRHDGGHKKGLENNDNRKRKRSHRRKKIYCQRTF